MDLKQSSDPTLRGRGNGGDGSTAYVPSDIGGTTVERRWPKLDVVTVAKLVAKIVAVVIFVLASYYTVLGRLNANEERIGRTEQDLTRLAQTTKSKEAADGERALMLQELGEISRRLESMEKKIDTLELRSR